MDIHSKNNKFKIGPKYVITSITKIDITKLTSQI